MLNAKVDAFQMLKCSVSVVTKLLRETLFIRLFGQQQLEIPRWHFNTVSWQWECFVALKCILHKGTSADVPAGMRTSDYSQLGKAVSFSKLCLAVVEEPRGGDLS